MKLKLGLVLLAACGANSAEIKTAKTSTYRMNCHDLLSIAEDVASQDYKLGDVNDSELSFITQLQWYGPEGDRESPGAGGFVNLQDRSVSVALIVQITSLDGGECAAAVTPKTFQLIKGYPKPRELTPDDPNLPPWIHGRADALSLAIYDRAKANAVAH
jgi:hypothetical protein